MLLERITVLFDFNLRLLVAFSLWEENSLISGIVYFSELHSIINCTFITELFLAIWIFLVCLPHILAAVISN